MPTSEMEPPGNDAGGLHFFYHGMRNRKIYPDGTCVDSSIIPYITGGGGALVVLAFVAWAFFTGKLHSDPEFTKLEAENSELKAENDAYREALRTERRTSDDIADTAKVTNKLIDTLATLALERRVLQPGNATQEDLGL